MWATHHGLPAPGREVLHRCANLACSIPAHLILGSPARRLSRRVEDLHREALGGKVWHLLGALNAILSGAVEDQIIVANPLAKRLGLGAMRDGGRIKALDVEQLRRFLAVARERTPEDFPAFATMAWAGLRVGEVLALSPDRLDLDPQTILVDRQISGTTKTAAGERTVDMADALRDLLARRRQEAFRRGEPASPWLFYPDLGDTPDRKAEQRVVKRVRPHSLRHSFASQLVAAGVSPAYVQQQMGHASISMTVDVYGSWLPVRVDGAVTSSRGRHSPREVIAGW